MKIVSLHIYHFGTLKDCKLTLDSSGFQLLFGENEAGKTTLLDFITCMLFGFPTRNQLQRRYEPKDGNRLGGKIMIEHPKLGLWTIERIEGSKISGDVSIYDETGNPKEESFLHTLLESVDQSLFQGAYCFGLDGLQKLDKLTSEELGNFLLSTALSGDKDLLEIEQTFEKKQSELFKKAGKKPVINEKMEQLKIIETSLNELRQKNESYQSVKEQKENLEKRIHIRVQELENIQKERRSLKRLFELKPILEKYKQMQIQLKSFDQQHLTFPENGIQRYEQWNKEVSLLTGELNYLEDRLVKTKTEQETLGIDEEILANRNEIKRLFNKLPQQELLQKQLLETEQNAAHLHHEEMGLFEALEETWHSEDLKQLTLSLSSLNEHELLVKQKETIQEKRRRLEADLEDSRMKLETLEKEEAEIKNRLLSDEDYARIEQGKNKKLKEKNFPLYAILMPVVSALLLIWSGWISHQSAVMYSGVLLLIIAAFITFTSYRKRETSLVSHHTDQQLLEDDVNRKQWIGLTASLSHENKVYLQLAKQLDFLEIEEARLYESAEEWADRNGYTGTQNKLLLAGYMNSLFKAKELIKLKEGLQEKIEQYEDELLDFENEVCKLAAVLEVEVPLYPLEFIAELYGELEKQIKINSEIELLEKNGKELLQRKQSLKKQVDHINDQIEGLWKDAEVRNEEDYYQKGRLAASYFELSVELDRLNNQLLSIGLSTLEIHTMADQVTNQYDESVQLLESIEKKEQEWKTVVAAQQEEKSKLQWDMKKLLEDGSYSEHIHRYELLKGEWNKIVKQWASYRLAQHALQVVKENYQQTKLPAVLETSSVYFSKITEGEYQSILFTKAHEMIVLKTDGTRYYPYELSRGTAEQVYLSIRLAVATNAGPAGFPIFMDDIAVNFDAKRTKKTMSLLQEVAHNRQILFFTCHSHLASIVPSAPLIHWPNQAMFAEK